MAINILGGSLLWKTKVDTSGLKKGEKESKGILKNLASSISSLDVFAAVGASAAAAFMHVVEVNKNFEKSLSSLQSILGVTNEELKFFKEAAIEMGAESTKTSQQVVDAFKLIGSQKPELLQNSEALKEVTRQAIILSEAAEIDVPTAAKAVTNALNQMGESAEETARFVNALAAGSKFGAADIPYLNAAIEKSGAVARDANLSFEELVGAIETIAPSISEPTTAGLQFRSVLLRLQQAGKGMSSGQFDLKEALEQTKAEFEAISDPTKRAQEETKLFGLESIVTGKALINNIDKFEEYTAAVTGTETALEQQRVNTNNLTSDYLRLASKVEEVVLSLNSENGLTNAIRKVVQFGIKLIDNIETIGKVIGYLVTVIFSYTAATKLATFWTNKSAQATLLEIATKRASIIISEGYFAVTQLLAGAKMFLTGNIKGATQAMRVFNATTKMNPLGLLIGLVTAAYFAFQEFGGEVESSNKYLAEFNRELIKEQTELDNVFNALKLTSAGTDARTQLIKEVNNRYGEYLDNLLTEASLQKEIEAAQIAATKALQSNIALKLKEKQIEETLNESINKRAEITKEVLEIATKDNKHLTQQATAEFNEIIKQRLELNNLDKEDVKSATEKVKKINKLEADFAKKYLKDKVSFYENEGLVLRQWTHDVINAEKNKTLELQEIDAVYSGYIIASKVETGNKEVEIIREKSLEEIQAMRDGIAKKKALLIYEYETKIQTARAAGESTVALESDFQRRLLQLTNKKPTSDNSNDIATGNTAEEIAAEQRRIEELRIEAMAEGIKKEQALLTLAYERKKAELEKHKIDTKALEDKYDAEFKAIKDNQDAEDKAKTKAKNEQEFLDMQALKLSEFILLETEAEKIKEFETLQEIERLERKLTFEEELTEIQRQAIENRIELLKQGKEEEDLVLNELAELNAIFFDKISGFERDRTKSSAENAEALKAVLLNSLRETLQIALTKSLAYLFEDTAEKFGVFGLIAVPAIIGGAKLLFNSLIPRFAEGGVIPSGHPNDTYAAYLKSNEVVLNGRQQANLLYGLAKNGVGGSGFDMNKMLKQQQETNYLLKTQRSAVMHENKLKVVDRHGNLTGDVISLQ